MAGATITTADAILKELYLGPIVEELNQKAYIIDQLERDSDNVDFTGRKFVVPVHYGRNAGKRAIKDGGAFAAAGSQKFKDATGYLRYMSMSLQVTDQLMKTTQSNEGAFVSALEAETKGGATDLRKDINRQMFGRGSTGGLCAAPSATTGVKKTSKSKKLEFNLESDLQYIEVGDIIDVLVETTGKIETEGVEAAEVTEKKTSSKEVTLGTSLGGELAAETYQVYISGSYGNESDGLRNICETGRELHGINSSTAGLKFWDSNTVKVGAKASEPAVATEDSFIQLFDQVGAKGNGDVEVCLTTRGIRRRLAALYQSQKRYNDAQAVQIHGGYSAIMVNEVPVVIDDMCPLGYAFAFNKSAFKIFEQGKPGFFEGPDGHCWFPTPESGGVYAASWKAYLIWYMALGCVAPNRTGRLEFCTDNVDTEGEYAGE
jgi:hypothetical protein